MPVPEELKNYRASDYDDAFQLVSADTALRALVTVLVIAAILEPVLR